MMADLETEEKKERTDGVYSVIAADDGSLPAKTDQEKQAMLRQRKLFEMDSYYQYIEPHTYKTRFIPITIAQAHALKLYFRGKDLSLAQYKEQRLEFEKLKTSIQKDIDTLRSELEQQNSDQKNDDCELSFFVRLSSRSPKDACDKPLFRKKLLELMRHRFIDPSTLAFNDEYKDLNRRLIGLRECFSRVMSVSNSEQMVELLSFSERCVSDLKRLMDHQHLLDKWDLYLVVREFRFIPIAHEFRCFVHRNKLTAITQYFPHCYFQKLIHANQDTIRAMIVDYYNNAVLKECRDLNLNVTTGPGFFDWTKDKSVLYGEGLQTDMPEIRVRTEVDTRLNAVLSQWSPIMSEFEERVNGAQQESTTCGDCQLM